jgi:uncharacterized membrane protein
MMDLGALEMKLYDILDRFPIDLSSYHPYIAHFAIALPFIVLIFQILNSKNGYKNSTSWLFFMSAFSIVLAFMSGEVSTSSIGHTFTAEEQGVFDMHKKVGSYLALGYTSLIILKLFENIINKDAVKHFIIFLSFIALAAVYYQAITGYELVFGLYHEESF